MPSTATKFAVSDEKFNQIMSELSEIKGAQNKYALEQANINKQLARQDLINMLLGAVGTSALGIVIAKVLI